MNVLLLLWTQSQPLLQTALALSAEGRSDSARSIVAAALARSRPGDPLYIEALYSRARLAGSADSAERDLRRVAIEFSTSRWADDALLQLAQLALASGNPPGALSYAQRLRGDYPGSELRAAAAFWGGRAAFDGRNPTVACALLDSARAEAASDIELSNQVAFYRSRCITLVGSTHPRSSIAESGATMPPAAPLPPPRDTIRPAPPPPAPARDTARAAPPAPARDTVPIRGGYDVQVAAPRSDSVAQAIAARFARAGMPVRVVPGADGYFRVRLGPYATLQAARDAALAARRLVPTNDRPFVVRQ